MTVNTEVKNIVIGEVLETMNVKERIELATELAAIAIEIVTVENQLVQAKQVFRKDMYKTLALSINADEDGKFVVTVLNNEMSLYTSVPMINNAKALENILPRLMKKDQLRVPSLTFTCNSKGMNRRAKFEIKSMSKGRLTKDLTMRQGVLFKLGQRRDVVNDFTFGTLQVSLDMFAKDKVAHLAFGNKIVIKRNVNGMVSAFVSVPSGLNDGTERFLNVTRGGSEAKRMYDYVPFNAEFEEMHEYEVLSWTASQKRQLTCQYWEVTNGDDRVEKLNAGTAGAIDMLNDKFRNDLATTAPGVAIKDIQKSEGYIGNTITGSVNFGLVESSYRINAKWEYSTAEAYLTDAFKEEFTKLVKASAEGNKELVNEIQETLKVMKTSNTELEGISVQDGQMYINVKVFRKMIEDKFNIVLDERALVGKMVQLRPGTVKASAVIVDLLTYKMLVKQSKEKFGDKVEYISTVGLEERVEDTLYIADKNCIKLDFNKDLEVFMEILAFAKISDGETNKQMIETILYCANEQGIEDADQLIYDIITDDIDEMVLSRLTPGSGKVASLESVNSAITSGFVTDVVSTIAPKAVINSKAFVGTIASDLVNSITNKLDKMHGKIVAHNRRLIADPVQLLTNGKCKEIVRMGEVFINDRKISKVAMMKWPKMGAREFYYAKNISVKTIILRAKQAVADGIITEQEANAIAHFYKNLRREVAVVPGNALVTFTCAGLDFDFDGALFIEYTENPETEVEERTNKIMDILEGSKMYSVVIMN